MSNLTNISSVDGRYAKLVGETLSPFVSECGLIRYRVLVECEYLKALAEEPALGISLTDEEKKLLDRIADVSETDAEIVKKIETEGYEGILATRHDVKAVEYFIKGKLKGTSLESKSEWVHFGLTSEDVNNIAYALMLSDAVEKALGPEVEKIIGELTKFSDAHAGLAMLARTHGQSATPTTFGKEFKVFAKRIERRLAVLKNTRIQAKLNGATGNWNAHVVAFPQIDWMAFSERFIDRFNVNRTYALEANLYTTQIECHDSYVALFDSLRHINTILIGFNQDMWRYISDGWVVQRPKEGEVGSSTMPHKVNPIDFENSEGNLGVANALCEHYARKLPISRLQRDLSDSTVERTFGLALAHSLIGYRMLLTGLGKIYVNEKAVTDALDAHPEVLAEAIQTVLRREGQTGAYEKLKDLTRGASLTLEDIRAFVWELPLPEKVREELIALSPGSYTGYAEKIARS
ncbi:adenylosuccinate lyase [Patescibacteria group bacterium]|nr:adenylosuccinate lyase [Patescibacteria group bacterium]